MLHVNRFLTFSTFQCRVILTVCHAVTSSAHPSKFKSAKLRRPPNSLYGKLCARSIILWLLLRCNSFIASCMVLGYPYLPAVSAETFKALGKLKLDFVPFQFRPGLDKMQNWFEANSDLLYPLGETQILHQTMP